MRQVKYASTLKNGYGFAGPASYKFAQVAGMVEVLIVSELSLQSLTAI